MIHVNVFGVLYCTHAALPLMGHRASGHIVNVSSVAGRFARAGSGVYNLTKFGVGAFSESLRQEAVGSASRHADRARRGRHRAPRAQPPRDAGADGKGFAGVKPLAAEDIAGRRALRDRPAGQRQRQRDPRAPRADSALATGSPLAVSVTSMLPRVALE